MSRRTNDDLLKAAESLPTTNAVAGTRSPPPAGFEPIDADTTVILTSSRPASVPNCVNSGRSHPRSCEIVRALLPSRACFRPGHATLRQPRLWPGYRWSCSRPYREARRPLSTQGASLDTATHPWIAGVWSSQADDSITRTLRPWFGERVPVSISCSRRTLLGESTGRDPRHQDRSESRHCPSTTTNSDLHRRVRATPCLPVRRACDS